MRAVAGSVLVLAAAVLIAATRLASRLAGPPAADEGLINLVLVVGALVVGLFGLAVLIGGLAGERRTTG